MNDEQKRWCVAHEQLTVHEMYLLLRRYKWALEGLTPGGSEYVNEPEKCAAYVRQRIETYHRLLINAGKESA